MIKVTELHGKPRYVNADLIEFIELTPETQLAMRDGRRVFVRETPEEVVELIVAYKQRCQAPAPIKKKTEAEDCAAAGVETPA